MCIQGGAKYLESPLNEGNVDEIQAQPKLGLLRSVSAVALCPALVQAVCFFQAQGRQAPFLGFFHLCRGTGGAQSLRGGHSSLLGAVSTSPPSCKLGLCLESRHTRLSVWLWNKGFEKSKRSRQENESPLDVPFACAEFWPLLIPGPTLFLPLNSLSSMKKNLYILAKPNIWGFSRSNDTIKIQEGLIFQTGGCQLFFWSCPTSVKYFWAMSQISLNRSLVI